jgi:hypothetical protein
LGCAVRRRWATRSRVRFAMPVGLSRDGRAMPDRRTLTHSPQPRKPHRRSAAEGAATNGILVVRLLRVEIHRSARRHGVADEDIDHAYRQAVMWVELGDDPPRYLVVGPDRSGNLLELVVIGTDVSDFVIHAMTLRRSTQRELFGDEQS